jgi:hypothetical protein
VTYLSYADKGPQLDLSDSDLTIFKRTAVTIMTRTSAMRCFGPSYPMA